MYLLGGGVYGDGEIKVVNGVNSGTKDPFEAMEVIDGFLEVGPTAISLGGRTSRHPDAEYIIYITTVKEEVGFEAPDDLVFVVGKVDSGVVAGGRSSHCCTVFL